MTVRTALAAMLRATGPGEAGLPEAERLAAVRPGAILACNKGFRRNGSLSDAQLKVLHIQREALTQLLIATSVVPLNMARFVDARVVAQAALAEPEPDTAAAQAAVHGLTVAQFVTAKAFHRYETDVARGFADAQAVEPELTAREWEARNPFLPSAVTP